MDIVLRLLVLLLSANAANVVGERLGAVNDVLVANPIVD
jgi:hypothetical protein